MPDGSKTNSSSKSNGRASQRNMTLGRMLKILTQMMAHNSYKKETRISTWRRTSTEDTQTQHNGWIPQICAPNQLDTRGYEDSLQGCWTLGGGYFDEYHIFQTLPTPSDTSDTSAALPL
jgi:hypothetical protein